MLTEHQVAKSIRVKIFGAHADYEELEKEVNEWLSNCEEHIFDITYRHCFSAWSEKNSPTGVGMEREFSMMVTYGQSSLQ